MTRESRQQQQQQQQPKNCQRDTHSTPPPPPPQRCYMCLSFSSRISSFDFFSTFFAADFVCASPWRRCCYVVLFSPLRFFFLLYFLFFISFSTTRFDPPKKIRRNGEGSLRSGLAAQFTNLRKLKETFSVRWSISFSV